MTRRLEVVTAAVAVVVVLAWTMLVWSPGSHQLHTRRAAADAAVQQQAALQTQLSRLHALQAHQALDQQAMAKLQAAIPDQAALDTLVTGLNTAAGQAGVDLLSIGPAPPSTFQPPAGPTGPPSAAHGAAPAGAGGTSLQEVHLSLTAGGNGPELLDFLSRLDGLPRILVVDGVSFSGGKLLPAGQADGHFTVQINARAFVAPPAGTAKPAA